MLHFNQVFYEKQYTGPSISAGVQFLDLLPTVVSGHMCARTGVAGGSKGGKCPATITPPTAPHHNDPLPPSAQNSANRELACWHACKTYPAIPSVATLLGMLDRCLQTAVLERMSLASQEGPLPLWQLERTCSWPVILDHFSLPIIMLRTFFLSKC